MYTQNDAQEFNKEFFVQSVRQVVSAVTDLPGSDCILYAAVGAGLLSKLGFDAEPAAGSAAWRVGEGDADVISHATEITGPVYGPGASEGKLAGMFHAWVSVSTTKGDDIVDLTTWQLKKKGRELDLADGGTTTVDYCPDFLWVSADSDKLLTPRDVLQSYDSGVFAYIRKPSVESVVFNDGIMEEAQRLTVAAHLCYQTSLRGEAIAVVGINENGVSEVHDDTPMKLRQVRRI